MAVKYTYVQLWVGIQVSPNALAILNSRCLHKLENLHYRLIFDQGNPDKNEIPRKNVLKIQKFSREML